MKLKKMKNKTLIIGMLLALCGVSAKAQQNEEVTVEGTFRPQIRKSERIAVTPGSPNNNFGINVDDLY